MSAEVDFMSSWFALLYVGGSFIVLIVLSLLVQWYNR